MNPNRKFSDDMLPPEFILQNFDIQNCSKIVDAACGSGYMAKAFAQKLIEKNSNVYALDIDPLYIGYLEEEELSQNLQPVLCDMSKKTPFEDESIDLLYISGAYHIFNKEQEKGFDKEVKRILKPKGRLVVVNFKKIQTSFGPSLHIRSTPQELEEKISLSPLKLIDLTQYFYMYIFQKD
jgi:ubiquinone/menaquinone biosynthesis C-methylase UbiE